MTQFKGRLFGGRLFAGRLYRNPTESAVVRPDVIPYGTGSTVYPKKSKPRRRDRDDDVLLFLLR